MINRQKFINLIMTGAIVKDISYRKSIAMSLVEIAWEIPEKLLNLKEYDEYTYACEILDFEYGLFDKFNEEYPEWVNKYWEWKQSRDKKPKK